jgi:hypothetical protein
MHTLHVKLTDPPNPLNAAKGVRAARLALGRPVQLAEAAQIVKHAEDTGLALVGKHADLVTVKGAHNALLNGSVRACEGFIDLSPEGQIKVTRDAKSPAPEAAPQPPRPEPSNIAHRVAIQFMAMTNGNPLVAAAHAHRMGIVAEEPQFFAEVVAALVITFPWIESKIEEMV